MKLSKSWMGPEDIRGALQLMVKFSIEWRRSMDKFSRATELPRMRLAVRRFNSMIFTVRI